MPVDKSAARIRTMFGEIAGRYDLLNGLLSMGIDRWWRWRMTRLVPPSDDGPILDVCTGTADVALAYWRAAKGKVPVLGADFCRPMLAIGRQKAARAGVAGRVLLVEADAQRLPFAANTFQIVCVAFGLRNVADTDRGLAELCRVCRPGGHVAVLEFSMPTFWPLKLLYGLYFRWVVPLVGQALASNRQDAYNYLPASVGEFPHAEALAERMRAAGMQKVRFHPLTFGVATLYVGQK